MANDCLKNSVVFIVEGESDKIALEKPFEALFDTIDSSINVVFCILGENGGDITSNSNISKRNIADTISNMLLDELKNKAKIFPENIYEIIHITDADATFLPSERIVQAEPEEVLDHNPFYDAKLKIIKSYNRENIIRRNDHKGQIIKYLISLDFVEIQKIKIPYRIYYFSSNLDHYLHNEPNAKGKKSLAKAFSSNYLLDPEGFADFFIESNLFNYYDESWEHLMMSTNSIEAGTNLGLFIKRIMNSTK